MNIKYSKKKEELRRDPVLESIEKARVFITENSNRLVTSLVIIVLLFAGFWIFSYVRKTKLLRSQEDFGRAMLLYTDQEITQAMDAFNQVIESHGNTPHVVYSAYMIGHIYLASEKYDKAIDYFETAYQSKKNTGFVKGESLEALATCYEAKRDLEKSLEYFENALKDKTIEYRYPAIRWKMALLYKKLGNNERVVYYCTELVSDTLALDFKKKAENLLAAM